MEWLEINFIWFVIYSFIGWLWEVIICSLPAKKFINRGFLNGPYCPIYGSGALLVITLLSAIENIVLLFAASAILTCTLEYITSWAMEKLFSARWWDYSKRFLNINGRVCLVGAVAFGTLSTLLIKFVHPIIEKYTFLLPEMAVSIISLLLFALMLIDAVYTITRFSDFKKNLEEVSEKLNLAIANVKEQHKSLRDRLQENEIYKRINSQERRMLKVFPKLKLTHGSEKYNEALMKVREYIIRKNEEKKK